jgi:magnesium-transporting ATPase (P-type)
VQETPVSELARAWHSIPVADALTALRSASSGLTEEEAQARLLQSGPNRLPESARRSALTRFLLQFHNLLIYLLLASASVTLYLGHLADTAVILAVVVANAVIGLVQEGKAERALESIRGMLGCASGGCRRC